MKQKPATLRINVKCGTECGEGSTDPVLKFEKSFELRHVPTVPCRIYINDRMLDFVDFVMPYFNPKANEYVVSHRLESRMHNSVKTATQWKMAGWSIRVVEPDKQNEPA